MGIFAIVPVKKLEESKRRLSKILTGEERIKLTLTMLKDVLDAIDGSSIDRAFLIGSNYEIKKIAEEYAFGFLSDEGGGLNRAVEKANNRCSIDDAEASIFIPLDLPLITSEDLNSVVELYEAGVQMVITPSRDLGTNLFLRRPPKIAPHFFGERSFIKNVEMAVEEGVKYEIYRSPNLTLDIDTVDDLIEFLRMDNSSAAMGFLLDINVFERLKNLD